MIKNKRLVVALGGNAILTDDASAQAQLKAVYETCLQLTKIVQNNNQLVIAHGNGPQVGNLLLQQAAADTPENPAFPLDTAVAMTQGSIGYWLQQSLDNVLRQQNIPAKAATIVTQTLVDENDSAFTNPTKPIGPFYDKETADKLKADNPELSFVEDAGRGYRQVVASPLPIDIIEADVVDNLLANNFVPISVGGGGVPVVEQADHQLAGVPAVIDKDFASEKLAEIIKADQLIILTAVDNVYINFNKPDQKKLTHVSVAELEEYIKQGQFAAGSMLPKVQAAINFVKTTGNSAVITSLDNLDNYLANESGTVVEA